MSDYSPEKTDIKQIVGRFQKGVSGNPRGKPKGTKSKANQLFDKLFSKDTTRIKNIAEKTISLAEAGKPWAILAMLDRLWPVPKGALMSFPLPPIKTAADVAAAQEGLLQAVANGQITAGAAVELSGIVTALGKALESSDMEARLAKLEKLATVQR